MNCTSKTVTVNSTVFLHCNIHKVTWTSPYGKTHNQTDRILIDRRRRSNILDVRSFRPADSDTDHCFVTHALMELSPSRETANSAATQELPSVL
jgi:hypothetical protein